MEYITLKEASKIVGLSPMTIRRYALRLLKSKKERVRACVKEPVKKGSPYFIDKDKVMLKFGIPDVKQSKSQDIPDVKEGLTNDLRLVITTLTKQLEKKDIQLARANNRLRESHVLLLKEGIPEKAPKPTVMTPMTPEPIMPIEPIRPTKPKTLWQKIFK